MAQVTAAPEHLSPGTADHPPPGPRVSAALALADRLRRRWLRALGPLARPLMRRRDLRVALAFTVAVVTALAATLVAPLWLLLLGPLVWGVPHVAADLRYLVVRTGYHRRRLLWPLAGGPLLWLALGGQLAWGFLGAAAVALAARARLLPRLAVALALLAGGLAARGLGPVADVVFAHLHNLLAVALWWLWRPRRGRASWLPLALMLAAGVFLLLAPAVELARGLGGLDRVAAGVTADAELWRLAPGLGPDLGLRLVLLFCFAQSVHYAVWMRLIPDDDRPRATPPTFRAGHDALRRDLGDAGLAVVALLTLGIAAWAVLDLAAANRGYFRMARFHGHLELMAGALLLLERPRGPTRATSTSASSTAARSGSSTAPRPRLDRALVPPARRPAAPMAAGPPIHHRRASPRP